MSCPMFMFWIITLGLALVVGLSLAATLLRDKSPARTTADFDIDVYRDQLAEVERDLARGVIDPDTAKRTRTEVSRRILEADRNRKDGAVRAPRRLSVAMALLALLGVAGGSFLLYSRLGAPGYGDLPLAARLERSERMRAQRPSQEIAEQQVAANPMTNAEPDPQYVELVERLRQVVAERPDDVQGYTLLAQNEAALGNFAAAHEAQARRLDLLGEDARADDWADYADLLVLAAGGYVSPQAESALARALSIDPTNGPARYYSGLLFAQTDRPDKAFGVWRQLLDSSDPHDPWVPAVRAQITDAAARAGVRYDLPPLGESPPLVGPSAEQVEAARDMTPDDRMAMIRGMVEGLSSRLATEGGPAEEWARLINALGVLGELGRAQAIWEESQTVFADDQDALTLLDDAARRAGLLQ